MERNHITSDRDVYHIYHQHGRRQDEMSSQSDACALSSPSQPPQPRQQRGVLQTDGRSEARATRLVYSDALLREIGKQMSERWRELGGYLKVTVARMDAVVERGGKTPEQLCAAMFKAWWRKSARGNVRWEELCRAFVGLARMDLLLQTLTFLGNRELDYRNPDSRTMEKYFNAIARPLASRWKETGCYLHLAPEMLDKLAEESRGDLAQWAFQMLKMWRVEAASNGGTPFELVRVLSEDMGRFDVAITILLDFMKQEEKKKECS